LVANLPHNGSCAEPNLWLPRSPHEFSSPLIARRPYATRLMYRSRHIYILASGLVNLMLGLYLPRTPQGWRGTVRTVGSVLLLISPVLLILAFVSEPAKGFQPEMVCSVAGLYVLFGGCMAHLAAGIGNRV
jgi:hypothetical protein